VRALLQRVSEARVEVAGDVVGQCGPGLLILLAVTHEDTEAQAAWLARKLAGLRIFQDADGKMNLSMVDCGGSALVVSQFTLYGDSRRGRRPSFVHSARPEHAEPLYERFCELLAAEGPAVERGVFGAMMEVALVNDGPVTLIVDTP
jgi:D-aminoacyl-tRNA deacylase